MCGFYGSTNCKKIEKSILNHRGPDNFGLYSDENILLEHWRLSILDLSSLGNQPMTTPDASKVIVYNGEVYNFREIKSKLSDYPFQSNCDTEVILAAYDQLGLNFLRELNGMFSFALYDKAANCIILARDRFGIKPLYYTFASNGDLSFGSELKALMPLCGNDLSLDINAIQSLFHLLYIQGERTPFNEIKKLQPGHYLIYDLTDKSYQIEPYYTLTCTGNTLSEAQCLDTIDDLLSTSVRMHLVSDVPVGALLSGGVDSSLLVAMARQHSDDLRTFSVGFDKYGKFYDETIYSDIVAEMFHTTHRKAILAQSDLSSILDVVASLMDEPIGDTSVILNHYIFSFVSQSVKVCISGLGGDELFGGYNRYLTCRFLPIYNSIPPFVRAVFSKALNALPSSRSHKFGNKIRQIKTFIRGADRNLGDAYCKMIDYFSNETFSPVLHENAYCNEGFDSCWDDKFIDETNRIFSYDIKNYMVDDLLFLTDRMSMVHSLEMRVPFLENRLVEFAMSIPPHMKIKRAELKFLLKKVALRYLPKEIIYRRKQGFSSPISAILTAKQLERLLDDLHSNQQEYTRILNKPLFTAMVHSHLNGKEDYSLQLFTLIIFLKWMGNNYPQ